MTSSIKVRQNYFSFSLVSLAIKTAVPGAKILSNQIPKSWEEYDLYTNLWFNDDPGNDFYGMVPREDSFEISYKGYLVFSRLGGHYWPAIGLVANKCATVAYHEPHGCDLSNHLAGMGTDRFDGKQSPSKAKKIPLHRMKDCMAISHNRR